MKVIAGSFRNYYVHNLSRRLAAAFPHFCFGYRTQRRTQGRGGLRLNFKYEQGRVLSIVIAGLNGFKTLGKRPTRGLEMALTGKFLKYIYGSLNVFEVIRHLPRPKTAHPHNNRCKYLVSEQ